MSKPGVDSAEEAADQIEQWTIAEGRNVYIALNPMRGEERKKEQTAHLVANWVDLDCGVDAVDEALSFALAQQVKPSLAVMSGDGLHLHYYNDSVDYPEWLAKQEGLHRTFSEFIRSTDRQVVTDQARLLKLVGTVASKRGEYQGREVALLHRGETVDGQALMRAFPWEQQPTTPPTTGIVAKAAPTFAPRVYEQAEEHIDAGYTVSKGTGCEEDHDCGFKRGRESAIWSLANSLATAGTPRHIIQRECERFNEECCDPILLNTDGDNLQRQIDRGLGKGEENRETKIEEGDDGWSDAHTDVDDVDDDVNDGLVLRTLGEVVDMVHENTDELLPGFFRKMLGMIYGPDGIGKTVFLLKLIFSQMVGKQFAGLVTTDRPKKQMRALYIEAEDGAYEATNRCQKIVGGDYTIKNGKGELEAVRYAPRFDSWEASIIRDNVIIVSEAEIFGQPMNLKLPTHVKALRRAIKKSQADLIIVDTMKQAFVGVDENSNSVMQDNVVTPMTHLARKEDVGVLLVHRVPSAAVR